MNAIIGDNGIITRAQEANIQSSIANLEEFLQLKYTENYEEMAQYKSKIEGLTNVCSDYFYIPSKEGVGGLRYVIDSDGHALYLIKKSGLPEEIRESLVGGDAGEGSYTDYQSLNDVYGITSNLKVYYCSGGTDSIKGLAKENLDEDNLKREVFKADSEMSGVLGIYDQNGDGIINAEEAKSVRDLTLGSDSGVNSLKDLYNLTSLRELTLDNLNLNNLSGIENCSNLVDIIFLNYGTGTSKIIDYSALCKLNKLEHLYLITSNDNQVNEVFNTINKIDFFNLQYLGVYNSGDKVTNIDVLSSLTDATKKAIKYLYFYQNNINDISVLLDYVNVVELQVYNNANLTSLHGVKNMENLTKLVANNCSLGLNENLETKNEEQDSLFELSDKVNLSSIELQNNRIIWIGYLRNNLSITRMLLAGNSTLNDAEVALIKNIYLRCMVFDRNIDSKYNKFLNSSNRLDYSNQNLQDNSAKIIALQNDTVCEALNLTGNVNLTNDVLQSTLKTMTNMKYLCLCNLKNLSSVDFVKSMPNLIELDIRGTSAIDLTLLEDSAQNLLGLWIDNENIDLSKIQKTISRLDYGASSSLSWSQYRPGLGITNLKLMQKLGTCSEITTLDIYNMNNSELLTGKVDLSGCKNLKKILFGGTAKLKITLKLPSNMNTVTLCRENYLEFLPGSSCDTVEILWSNYSQEELNNALISLGTLTSISTLRFQPTGGWQGNDLCTLSELANTGLKNFIFTTRDDDSFYITGVTDLSGLENILSLESLTFNKTNVNNVSGLSDLVNLKTLDLSNNKIMNITGLENLINLEKLILSNNQISNLYPLKNLNTLQWLNLENNLIYDNTPDPDGHSFNNIQLLVDLNKNGNLKNLFIKGNSGIVNFSPLFDLTWDGKSGF